MQVFILNDSIVAWHSDDQAIPLNAYPGSLRLIVADDYVFERIGEAPEQGVPDDRPFKAPVIGVEALISYVADKRWQIETGGIHFGGMIVATDDRSKLMIMGARTKAKEDPAHTKRWKTASGFVVLNASTLIAIADQIEDHVQTCFDLEADLIAEIETGDITTIAQIDAADWPVSSHLSAGF